MANTIPVSVDATDGHIFVQRIKAVLDTSASTVSTALKINREPDEIHSAFVGGSGTAAVKVKVSIDTVNNEVDITPYAEVGGAVDDTVMVYLKWYGLAAGGIGI